MMDHPDMPDTLHTLDTPDISDATGIADRTDTQGPSSDKHEAQGKLILTAPLQEYRSADQAQRTMFHPGPFLPPRPFYKDKSEIVPRQPLAKLRYYWRKDPAYQVFILATCMVIIAGIIFVSFASAAIIKHPRFFGLSAGSTASSIPTPAGTVDFQPVFPTPGGGQGSTVSSQPPVVSTPVLAPTDTAPTPVPTTPNPGSGGPLNVQITAIPQQVSSGQTVQVVASASIAGAVVRLQVIYNAPPYFYISSAQQVDANGNVVLFWRVEVGGFARGHVTARVVALATANGQRANSQQITVQVNTFMP